MSHWLHRSRLWWSDAHGKGVAIHEGVSIELTQRPPVMKAMGRLIEIDYSPAIGVQLLQTATGAREDMRTEQAAECLRYLRAVAVAARRAADEGAE